MLKSAWKLLASLATACLLLAALAQLPFCYGAANQAPSLQAPSHRRLLDIVRCVLHNTTYHPSSLEVKWNANVKAWGTNFTYATEFCTHLAPDFPAIKAGLVMTSSLMSSSSPGKGNIDLSDRTYMSHFTYTLKCGAVYRHHRVLIEPLIGSLRHPLFPCTSPGNASWTDSRLLGAKEYLLLASVYTAPWQYVRGMKVFVFDLGASVYAKGAGGTSQKWFVETLLARGFEVDQYFAWEVQKYNGSLIYGDLPDWLLPRYHYFNIPAPTGVNDPANPLNIVKRIATPEDYVVIKLDVDNAVVEMELIRQLLSDAMLPSLVDDFFFEHHVWLGFMKGWWRNGPISGTLEDSYKIFSQLRQSGIRAHGWV